MGMFGDALDAHLIKAALLATRLAGMIALVPWWGASVIPARVRLVLVLALTVAMFPAATVIQWQGDALAAAVQGMPVELMVGLGMGLALKVVLGGISSAGKVLSVEEIKKLIG